MKKDLTPKNEELKNCSGDWRMLNLSETPSKIETTHAMLFRARPFHGEPFRKPSVLFRPPAEKHPRNRGRHRQYFADQRAQSVDVQLKNSRLHLGNPCDSDLPGGRLDLSRPCRSRLFCTIQQGSPNTVVCYVATPSRCQRQRTQGLASSGRRLDGTVLFVLISVGIVDDT